MTNFHFIRTFQVQKAKYKIDLFPPKQTLIVLIRLARVQKSYLKSSVHLLDWTSYGF